MAKKKKAANSSTDSCSTGSGRTRGCRAGRAEILGPLCFDLGPSALSLVASHVASWPPPSPGHHPMSLPIGSASLRVLLPDAAAALFPDSDLFSSFRGLLLHLWTLWELVLIAAPLLVVAPSPPQCSDAVAALVSLVAPLRCRADFRPYFTIHDPDFPRLNSLPDGLPFPPMLLGVTNLFFLRALKSIPNVVSVGSPAPSSSRLLPPASSTAGAGTATAAAAAKKFSPSRLLNAVKLRRDGPLCLMTEHREAFWSAYAPATKPDTAVLNRLVDAGVSPRIEESMSVVNNEILRRHFLELTTNFLAPFGPYLRATAPSEGSSPFVDPPPLPPFRADEFLDGLAARGPGKFLSKRMRSNWLDLYRWAILGRAKFHAVVPKKASRC
ncbi:Protein DENND6B [Ananas comosus]|uniref:Protein DENND6B n=1 Tax=Ananas comosus TaxID=4615 RepID=A0A199VVN4_ANACO|nr:Protein DENND6B [Ananas comosus]